ncbi:uncharacterized protein PGRI_093300 [Penicillium griseofulvum]|uniref:Uncharacterized protein n=1 Tax=Penicillium patulum TaxID=5078 RepID=A0A135LQR7_PENPA|nr:uncharacterized protein PGRI_093300 [Penicillium griseofulvum]KXG51318.1 hypothetical protein PGRI_093300 [Penicillium griseofulvum]
MESTGFVVLSASSDGADIKLEVKRFLHLKPKREQGPFVYGRGDADTCGQFLRCGTEESDAFAGKIKEAIGEVDFLIRQGPVIVLSSENHSTWGTRLAHPSRNAVSIFRDLSDTDETRVTFMLYPPDLPKEEIRETRPVMRKLQRNEILFVNGLVRMELEVPAEGSFVWQGNSGEPMGRDMLGPEVFEFMAL